jgi:hypothetical protein
MWWLWAVGVALPGRWAWAPLGASIAVWLVLMWVETQTVPTRQWRKYRESVNRRE